MSTNKNTSTKSLFYFYLFFIKTYLFMQLYLLYYKRLKISTKRLKCRLLNILNIVSIYEGIIKFLIKSSITKG